MRPPIPTLFRLARFAIAALLLAAGLPAQARAADAVAPAAARTVLVVGDSLSAEYGIARGTGWVPLLGARLAQRYPNYRVVNASISGDTTRGGLARLPALLARDKPAVVVLELGANDALRGLPLNVTEQNLNAMARRSIQAGARVLVVGMQIPPNYGRDYAQRFMNVFPAVARAEHAALVPFLLDGIAADRSLFQADGLHPVASAQPRLMENVWKVLEPMLDRD
jgi:acyl-CoA thioesterase-1